MSTIYQTDNYLENFVYNDIAHVKKIERTMNTKAVLVLGGYPLFINIFIIDQCDILWLSILFLCLTLVMTIIHWKSVNHCKKDQSLRTLVKCYYIRSMFGILIIEYNIILLFLFITHKQRESNDLGWILLIFAISIITILVSLYMQNKYMKIKESKANVVTTSIVSLLTFLVLRFVIRTELSIIILCIAILIVVLHALCTQIIRSQRLLKAPLETLQDTD